MSKKDFDLTNAEIETKQCKVCGEYKPRVFDGKFNKKDKRWRSPEGLLWNGLTCPECHKNKVAKHISKKRNKLSNENS
jgi:ssDNA-binding Zn-finger/Zn-ribbon topoisomerase 1